MRAVVNTKYGSPDVLQFVELEKPAAKDDEVLIKVQAVSINAYDWHLLSADIPLVRMMGGGLLKPKITILGADVAGRVESVGVMRCSETLVRVVLLSSHVPGKKLLR
jgi:NADPH:quinone reductase-like Zn-dependent oxidoreductase